MRHTLGIFAAITLLLTGCANYWENGTKKAYVEMHAMERTRARQENISFVETQQELKNLRYGGSDVKYPCQQAGGGLKTIFN